MDRRLDQSDLRIARTCQRDSGQSSTDHITTVSGVVQFIVTRNYRMHRTSPGTLPVLLDCAPQHHHHSSQSIYPIHIIYFEYCVREVACGFVR